MIELKVEKISHQFFKELPNFEMIDKETKLATADKKLRYKKSNVNSFTSLIKSAQN